MIELFAGPNAEGKKVAIVLEELATPYRLRRADGAEGDPLGPVPRLYDPNGPAGAPLSIGEAPAIVFYLARKARRLGPETLREQAEFDFWAAVSARLAALGALQASAGRLLSRFDDRMATRHFMIGERFTVIDALLFPHLTDLAADGLAPYPNLARHYGRLALREGVRRGMAAWRRADVD